MASGNMYVVVPMKERERERGIKIKKFAVQKLKEITYTSNVQQFGFHWYVLNKSVSSRSGKKGSDVHNKWLMQLLTIQCCNLPVGSVNPYFTSVRWNSLSLQYIMVDMSHNCCCWQFQILRFNIAQHLDVWACF